MIAKPHNPPSLHPPFSAYSLGMEVSGAERWLHLSGQVGVKKDGSVPPGAEGQMEECWAKIFAVLESAAMEKGNLIKVTGFLTRPDDIGLTGAGHQVEPGRTERGQSLETHRAGSGQPGPNPAVERGTAAAPAEPDHRLQRPDAPALGHGRLKEGCVVWKRRPGTFR